jgi:protein-S-isoprenylcysteine O-methyltransferase Ste14
MPETTEPVQHQPPELHSGGTEFALDAAKKHELTEFALRAAAIVVFAFLIARLIGAYVADTSRYTLLVFAAIEAYTAYLVVAAKTSTLRDLSPISVIATVLASFALVLVDLKPGTSFVPEFVGLTIQAAGFAWQLYAKATLGKSFGLLPAARTLVSNGPYSVVRHPIYLGYLISHIGFLLVNFTWANLSILTLIYCLQFVRIFKEEKILSSAWPEYRDYQQRTRNRIIPGVL